MQNLLSKVHQQSIELDKIELVNRYLFQYLVDHKVPSLEEIETHRLERIKRNTKMKGKV